MQGIALSVAAIGLLAVILNLLALLEIKRRLARNKRQEYVRGILNQIVLENQIKNIDRE